jgi:hypothetical protein
MPRSGGLSLGAGTLTANYVEGCSAMTGRTINATLAEDVEVAGTGKIYATTIYLVIAGSNAKDGPDSLNGGIVNATTIYAGCVAGYGASITATDIVGTDVSTDPVFSTGDPYDNVDIYTGATITATNIYSTGVNGKGLHGEVLASGSTLTVDNYDTNSSTPAGLTSTLFIRNGGTTGNGFTPNVFIGSVSAGWSLAGIGDFAGNGKDDLLWFNQSSGTFSIWDSTGNAFTPNSYIGSVAAGWALADVGNFTGHANSQDDLLWRNTSTGTFSIWQSTAAGFTPNVEVGNVGTDWTLVSSPTHTHA